MPFQLVILRGRSDIKSHRLGPGVTLIGRQEGCTLQVKSSQVSRRHCELSEQKGSLILKDLGSSNGTYVNGEKVEGQRKLEAGDELVVGGVKFRVDRVTAPRPGDTAVPAVPAVAAVAAADPDDDMIPVDDETTVTSRPSGKPASPPPAPAATAAKAEEPEPEDDEATGPALGEDAVAGFLMDLELDEDDKT